MKKDFNIKITNAYPKIQNFYKQYNDKMFQFVTNAAELVDLSEDLYQIEKTIKLNKISLKSYVLNSNCCKFLIKNNISNYSINDLKKYLTKYEQDNGENCYMYMHALNLYELLNEIEALIEARINYEISVISPYVKIIKLIKNAKSEYYENIYIQTKNELVNDYFNKQLIDNDNYNKCMFMINDIFNYFLGGYLNIPNELLNE